MLGYVKINRSITNVQKDPIMDGTLFEGVQNFRYFGTSINKTNVYNNEELKSGFSTGNSCFCNRRQIFRYRAARKAVQN
jgi:hypothetical protein